MEEKTISILLVFAVMAIFLVILLSKVLSFNFMPFGFGKSKFGFVMLFGIAGVLVWLSYSMWK